jgi:hypothetical protein
LALWLCLALLAGCRSDPTEPPPPPPLPTKPELPTPTPTPNDTAPVPSPSEATQGGENAHAHHAGSAAHAAHEQTREAHAQASSKEAKGGDSLYDLAKRGEATLPQPPKANAPTPSAPAAPSHPAAPAPAPAPAKPANKTVVPHTDHLRFEIPAGLQAALDADPRMQPWLNQAVKVIDDCYSQERKKNANAAGVISVRLTMHEESRPDADMKSLPPALSGVVACATGGLMRTKMPLFTSKEGEHYNVNIDFSK